MTGAAWGLSGLLLGAPVVAPGGPLDRQPVHEVFVTGELEGLSTTGGVLHVALQGVGSDDTVVTRLAPYAVRTSDPACTPADLHVEVWTGAVTVPAGQQVRKDLAVTTTRVECAGITWWLLYGAL